MPETSPSRRNRLRKVLSEKLTSKYGSKAAGHVESELRKLFISKSGQPVTKKDIRALDKRVEILSKSDVVPVKRSKSVESRSKPKSKPKPKPKPVLASERAKQWDPVKAEKNCPLPLNSYQVFNEAVKFQHQRDEVQRKIERRKKQQRMRKELDDQVRERNRLKNNSDDAEAAYASYVNNDYKKWVQEKEERKQKLLEENLELKRQRDIQLKQLEERRARVRARQNHEDRLMVEKARRDLKEEEDKKMSTLMERKQFMAKMQKEYEHQKKVREIERQKEHELEMNLQRQYAEQLERQERQRKEAFEKMKSKSQSNQQMYILATEERDRQAREDEERALHYQRKRMEEVTARAKAAERKRRMDKVRMNKVLGEQVATREVRKQHLIDQEKEFAKAYKADAEKWLKEKMQREVMRRKEALRHKTELTEQMERIRARPKDTDSSVMTKQEQRINYKALMELAKDKELVDAVQAKLEKSKQGHRRKSRKPDDFDYVI